MNPSTSKAQIPLGPRQSCMYSQVIYWTSLSSYILTWIGTALLLHYYYKRRGENKIGRNLNKLHLQNSKAVKTKKLDDIITAQTTLNIQVTETTTL